MFNYALALEKGDGVERNEKLAAEFFEKSAERGNVQAMNAYGVCRYRARGVAKDFGTARKWFVKAAEKGYAPAMDNLAVLYEKGEGVEKSEDEAMLWKMRSRATRGDQAALEWLSSREAASPERSAAEEFLVYESSDFGPADKCGIACLAVDPVSGGIREVSRMTGVNGAIYLALSADGRRLYSTMEISREGKKRGALAVFGTEGGKLVELDRLELDCACPCHISLAPSGDAIVFADYGGGIAGVAAIAPNGFFDHSVKPVLVKHEGAGGKGRQDRPHAHCARVTPDGKYLCVADLGLDKVVFYDFPSWRDGLREVPEMTIRVAAALGPRHLEFSPDGRFIFVVHELGNAVSAYRYNGKTAPEETSTLSTLPEGFTGPSQVAAVHATRDGSILAVSNRGHDSIAFFKVDGEDGKLKLGNIVPLKGSFPRDFAFTPAEDAIVVGHKKDNEVLVYRFDRDRCALKALGKPFPAFRPLCFVPSPR